MVANVAVAPQLSKQLGVEWPAIESRGEVIGWYVMVLQREFQWLIRREIFSL